jgi:hypothetical protein
MAGISSFSKKVNNTFNRNGSVFIRDGSGSFVNAGRVKEASIEHDTITSDMDQDGRTSTQLLEMTAAFTLQQGTNVELSAVPDLARPDTSQTPFENGHVIYFAGNNQVSTSDVNDSNNTYSSSNNGTLVDYSTISSLDENGLLFVNVLLNPSPSLDLSGGQSVIPVEFQARFPPKVYADFDPSGAAQDGNHIVVSPK